MTNNNELSQVKYYCTNELCHFEWLRITDNEQTANLNCPTCGFPLYMEEV